MNQKKKKETQLISPKFIANICDRLAENKQVRRILPLNGRLHIDRSLPFLCIYRRPLKRPDQGTNRFVEGEASYIVVSSSPKLHDVLADLVQGIVNVLVNDYGAILLIEIWSNENLLNMGKSEIDLPSPFFQLRTARGQFPNETIESFEKALKRITVLKQKSIVNINYNSRPWPGNLPSLIPAPAIKKQNIFLIGLEINPVYRDLETGEIFPFVLRNLHRGVSRAIKQSVFTFSHHQTTHRPANYQALGRRAVVKAVWEVDKKLAEISSTYDFLLNVTPINIEQAWNQFKNNKFEKSPVFYYRPIPVDPALVKKNLYQIPIDKIEDPTLMFLFREKQIEMERELSMLRDRGTLNFFYTSLQVHGGVDNELAELASHLLTTIAPHSHESYGKSKINAKSFALRAGEEIERYRKIIPEISAKVDIRNDITGLMVSRGNLLIGQQISIPTSRVEALIQHEVGTHILTYFNGRAQPFQQLYTGLAGYDELQEGLAVLAEYLVGGLSLPRLRLLAGRVLATKMMINGASFVETYRELTQNNGFAQRTSYTITARIYRSGGLTKDAVYLRGLDKILKYLGNGGTLEPLLIGKISTWHIPIIKELESRQILKPAPLRPSYFGNEEANLKLKTLKEGISVLKLI